MFSTTPYWQTATQRTRGCQLDYANQCRNNTVYVCEIKFSESPIARAVIKEEVGEAGYFDAIIDFGELWR